MADNEKLIARVPIIPDDFENKDKHKVNELVMDYSTNDIYAKKVEGYVNITGKIKDEVKQIQDGSMVIHIVTESTLPPIKDRPENHWYYVITKSENGSSGAGINETSYVYYGLIDSYNADRNYILIAQNVIDGSSIVKIKVVEDYVPCFYVPITMGATFKNADTGNLIPYEILDRVYALNTELNTFIAYDVYKLDLTDPGEYMIDVGITGSDYYIISFDTNYDVAGLILPNAIGVYKGSSIGNQLPDEPEKSDPRYTFVGWSISQLSPNIIDNTYKPESSMKLYAYWEYNNDPTLFTYYADYYSTSLDPITGEHIKIGSYCGLEHKDVLIQPKTIAGYIKPEAQVLTTDAQRLEFYYEPVIFNIAYEMNGGTNDPMNLTSYTTEDEYTPNAPTYANHYFTGWTPPRLEKHTTGDFTFSANWEDHPILVDGSTFNNAIATLAGGLSNVLSIQTGVSLPTDEKIDVINVSSTSSPIYAWFTSGILTLMSTKGDIFCNSNMTGAFANMDMLRDITALASFIPMNGMVLTDLFYGDTLLADVSAVENWNSGITLGDFSGAFDGTAALNAGRTPSWYVWNVTIAYKSSTGITIDTITRDCVPGSRLYPVIINGYGQVTPYVDITNPTLTYTFIYDPIVYQITYNLDGGTIKNPKTSYTIENETYIPPSPIKDGYRFTSWSPARISHGDYGNMTFIAQYTPNS